MSCNSCGCGSMTQQQVEAILDSRIMELIRLGVLQPSLRDSSGKLLPRDTRVVKSSSIDQSTIGV